MIQKTGKIKFFVQFLKDRPIQIPKNIETIKDPNIILFYPPQIGFINTGMYGSTRKQILGYLEKARVPYNQLKLLETSVIIYRIVRSPERFVFKIDTGNMPIEKAMKFVEQVKSKMIKKQTFDSSTGRLSADPNVLSLLENFYLPVNSDGRGSSIETVGGDSKGFTELDDIYYFSKKLYRSLKYPISRVSLANENRSGDSLFITGGVGDITRDEIKWARYLEKQTDKFNDEMTRLFLLHLEFKGLKAQYGLTSSNILCKINPPNNYKMQMDQKIIETQFSNFNSLAGSEDFSKIYLMKKYLGMTDEDIEENYMGFSKDKDLSDKYKPTDDVEENNSNF